MLNVHLGAPAPCRCTEGNILQKCYCQFFFLFVVSGDAMREIDDRDEHNPDVGPNLADKIRGSYGEWDSKDLMCKPQKATYWF